MQNQCNIAKKYKGDPKAPAALVKKVKKEVVAFGKANGYTYILGGGDGGSVLYGTDANDVTDEILKILNEKYKK